MTISRYIIARYSRGAITRLELLIQRNRMREYAAPAQFIAVGWLCSSCHYHAVNVAIIVQMSRLKLVPRDPIRLYVYIFNATGKHIRACMIQVLVSMETRTL